MFQGYSYDEVERLIAHYSPRLFGVGKITTSRTPRLQRVSGQAQGFLALPFNPENESYEMFLADYQRAAFKDDWLAARRRESRRWLPFIIIEGQYLPLLPILIDLGIWEENWESK